MSAHDVVIDPALRDLPPPTHTAGVKRKARGSNITSTPSTTNNATTAAPSSDRARVTRRSAALLSAAQHLASPSDLQQQSQQRQPPDMEPTRGEEENKYQWTPRDSSAKRSRHRSPSSHAPRSGSAAAAVSASTDIGFDPGPAGVASSSSQQHSPSLGGIDNLAAAAAVFQSNPMPYPFGLTPFRYPCLTPHLPQPPPGDPNNPDFVPFDNTTEGTAVSTSSTTETTASTTLPPITSMSRHTSAGAGPGSGSRPSSRPPSRGQPDPFMSFSTLLAASEAHSTRHSSVAGSHPPSHRQTPERDTRR